MDGRIWLNIIKTIILKNDYYVFFPFSLFTFKLYANTVDVICNKIIVFKTKSQAQKSVYFNFKFGTLFVCFQKKFPLQKKTFRERFFYAPWHPALHHSQMVKKHFHLFLFCWTKVFVSSKFQSK